MLAVLLHTAWNLLNSLSIQTPAQFAMLVAGNIVIAVISLALVIRRYLEAKRPPIT